jgi:threonyl-tRNA synthetase
MGALVEHYGGDFPLWLAPVQVKLIPITEGQVDYAKELEAELRAAGFRVETDSRDEKMQKKIRDAEMAKIPYMVIVGKREAEQGNVSARSRKEGDIGTLGRKEFIDRIIKEAQDRQ